MVNAAEFEDAGLTIVDDGDNTKKIALDASAITTATTRTLTMADEAVDLAALKNSNISASAAIDLSKLAALTASEMVISDGSGVIVSAPVATYPSLTELTYLKGTTSSIQTQLGTKTDTGTANEITLTGTTIGLADNAVMPGTDSMVVPVGTTAQRVSTTDGALRFNSDLNRYEGYKSSAWSEIGGGGGGLDIFYDEDFAVTTHTDFTTGNNAAPDAAGTGTLDGTLATETSSPLAGTASLKYTMGSTSANDFFINDADIALDTKQVSNFIGIDFYYTYNGDDDDIRFIVLDQDDAEVASSTEYLKSASGATRFSTSVYIPSGTTGLRYGFQVVTGNSAKVVVIDDIQLTTNPFVYKNLTVTESAAFNTYAGYGSTNNKIPYFTTELANTSGDIITVANDSTNGFSITANKKCTIVAQFTFKTPQQSTPQSYFGFSLNSTQLTTSISSITNTDRLVMQNALTNASIASLAGTATIPIELEEGDVLRPHATGSAPANTAACSISVIASAQSEHVITPAKSNMTDWTAYTPTYSAGFGTVTNNVAYYRRVGDSVEIQASFTAGTTTTSNGTMTLPSGLVIDSNKVSINNISTAEGCSVGRYARGGSSNAALSGEIVTATGTSTSLLYFANTYNSTSNHLIPTTSVSTTAIITGEVVSVNIKVPISGWDSNVTFLAAVPTQLTAYIKDVKSNGTSGGTFTSGAWQTRTLNTVSGDTSIVSLSSNQFTLGAGKYEIEATAMAFDVDFHKAQLYNITDTATEAMGMNSNARSAGGAGSTTSDVVTTVTITTDTIFELRHRCSTTQATDGFGQAMSFTADEVYAQVKITKIR